MITDANSKNSIDFLVFISTKYFQSLTLTSPCYPGIIDDSAYRPVTIVSNDRSVRGLSSS